MTGRAPLAPVPTTSCRHAQGMSSALDSGVCPNAPRKDFEGFFFRLRILPPSMTTSCSYDVPSIWMEPNLNLPKRMRSSSYAAGVEGIAPCPGQVRRCPAPTPVDEPPTQVQAARDRIRLERQLGRRSHREGCRS